MDKDLAKLKKKFAALFALALIVVGGMLFLPAGSIYYWEAWLYCAVLFVPILFVVPYLMKKNPKLLERRMRIREKEARQKLIVKLGAILFFVGFLVPGFDYRWQWSDVPVWLVIAANILVFLGYLIVLMVFKENQYASRIIDVEKGQKVITTGPYAVIRHPMYLGVAIMFLATPFALGSYWALIPLIPATILLVFRIFNEEKVLLRELPGYREYCQKTRHRLIPFVW